MKEASLKKGASAKNFLYLVIALLVGILLLVTSGSLDFTKEETPAVEEEEFELCEKRCEERIASLLEELEGVDSAKVLVTLDELPSQKTRPAVRGVAIVCQGRESAELKLTIVSLVRSALGVTTDRISVTFS